MPQLLYPWERKPVSTAKEAGWTPGLVWMGAENLALSGFDPRTFRPVASHYTDSAILALMCKESKKILIQGPQIKTSQHYSYAYLTHFHEVNFQKVPNPKKQALRFSIWAIH